MKQFAIITLILLAGPNAHRMDALDRAESDYQRQLHTAEKLRKQSEAIEEKAADAYRQKLQAQMKLAARDGDAQSVEMITEMMKTLPEVERKSATTSSDVSWIAGTKWLWDGGPNRMTILPNGRFDYTGWGNRQGRYEPTGDGRITARTWDKREWMIVFSPDHNYFVCFESGNSPKLAVRQ